MNSINLRYLLNTTYCAKRLGSFITLSGNRKDLFFAVSRNVNLRTFAMNNDMQSDNTWRGVPLSEIWGAQSMWGSPEFPLVAPGHNHTVLYHIPSNGCVAGDRPPKPQVARDKDKWDSGYVRMPCSSQSLYQVEDDSGETCLRKRWEMIENALRKPLRNSKELAAAILSYNTQFKDTWKFRALHKLFNEHLEEEESQYFFDVTLPEIAKLALALPKLIQAPIPLLKQHKNHSISLSQQQISSLLANAFFCTFPRRNSIKRTSEFASYPHINFNHLYESAGSDSVMEKLKCLCHYFRRVCSKVPVGAVTFARRSVPPRRCPAWAASGRAAGSVPLHVDCSATIEDASQLIQMDFANKYLGGGVLGHGCVQEEIRFVISPELMISMLFTELLRPNEALMMIGCERYSKYTGYGSSFQWAGAYHDPAPLDSSARRRVAVLALDALPYAGLAQQYRPPAILRELNKAWVGFSFYTEEGTSMHYPGIATGNWGCGAFGGSPELKSLIQLMACAEARRPMAYFTFQDTKIKDEIINVYNLLSRHNVTVGQLYHLLVRYCQTDVRKLHLHKFIHRALTHREITQSPAHTPQTEPAEQMDTVTISGDVETQLPESLQRELLKESFNESLKETSRESLNKSLKESPDMFAEDDIETLETQLMDTIEIEDVVRTEPKNKDQGAKCVPENKMDVSANKMAASDSKMATSFTSDLFDEMSKLDQSNGRLNLSKSHTNILTVSEPVTPTVDTSTESENKSVDPRTEAKKRMAKKITDYFSKRTL